MAAFRKLVIGSKALAFITLVSGAFVAGLDAGLVYNSFPKFADRWIPEDILAFSPTLRNITENPTTVQFNHRILGTSTLAALLLTAARAQSLPLPPHLRLTALALGGMGCLQVLFGAASEVKERLKQRELFSGGDGYHHSPALCSSPCGCSSSIRSSGEQRKRYSPSIDYLVQATLSLAMWLAHEMRLAKIVKHIPK